MNFDCILVHRGASSTIRFCINQTAKSHSAVFVAFERNSAKKLGINDSVKETYGSVLLQSLVVKALTREKQNQNVQYVSVSWTPDS